MEENTNDWAGHLEPMQGNSRQQPFYPESPLAFPTTASTSVCVEACHRPLYAQARQQVEYNKNSSSCCLCCSHNNRSAGGGQQQKQQQQQSDIPLAPVRVPARLASAAAAPEKHDRTMPHGAHFVAPHYRDDCQHPPPPGREFSPVPQPQPPRRQQTGTLPPYGPRRLGPGGPAPVSLGASLCSLDPSWPADSASRKVHLRTPRLPLCRLPRAQPRATPGQKAPRPLPSFTRPAQPASPLPATHLLLSPFVSFPLPVSVPPFPRSHSTQCPFPNRVPPFLLIGCVAPSGIVCGACKARHVWTPGGHFPLQTETQRGHQGTAYPHEGINLRVSSGNRLVVLWLSACSLSQSLFTPCATSS